MAEAGIKPHIDDPGLPGNNIISKVSITDWKNFIERIRIHAGYARRAQSEEDMAEATRLWRKLFGDRFKETVTAAKAESLAGYASAPVVSTSAGYTFPNQPAAPNMMLMLKRLFWKSSRIPRNRALARRTIESAHRGRHVGSPAWLYTSCPIGFIS